jgi:Rod binding domain-containing protein
VPDEGFFPKSEATKNYEEMLDGVLAQTMADSGQLGIAKQLEAETRRQEEGMALLAERARQRQGLEPLKPGPVSADNHQSLGKGE